MLSTIPYDESLVCCNPRISAYVNEDQIETRENPEVLGPRHKPAPFVDFIENIAYELDDNKWSIKTKCFVLSQKGERLFGAFTVEDESAFAPLPLNYATPVLIFRAAHDQAWSRQLNGGFKTYICDNTVISGELGQHRTKQTTFLDERQTPLITKAIDDLHFFVEQKTHEYKAMSKIKVTEMDAHNTMAVVYRKGGLNQTQLGKAITEYHDDPFKDDQSMDPTRKGTTWGVYNAMSSAIQNENQMVAHKKGEIITQITNLHYDIR